MLYGGVWLTCDRERGKGSSDQSSHGVGEMTDIVTTVRGSHVLYHQRSHRQYLYTGDWDEYKLR